LQLLHRLPEDLVYEIARHPFASPDAPTSLPFHPKTVAAITAQLEKQKEQQAKDRSPRSASSRGLATNDKASGNHDATLSGRARPPWKL
jgi:hypothetical protein